MAQSTSQISVRVGRASSHLPASALHYAGESKDIQASGNLTRRKCCFHRAHGMLGDGEAARRTTMVLGDQARFLIPGSSKIATIVRNA